MKIRRSIECLKNTSRIERRRAVANTIAGLGMVGGAWIGFSVISDASEYNDYSSYVCPTSEEAPSAGITEPFECTPPSTTNTFPENFAAMGAAVVTIMAGDILRKWANAPGPDPYLQPYVPPVHEGFAPQTRDGVYTVTNYIPGER